MIHLVGHLMARSNEDLILKQHHEMIVMKPTMGCRVTLIGRRLYSALLATSQLELNGVPPLATHAFEAPLKSLLRVSKGRGQERTVAKQYFQEMLDLKVTWESATPGDGEKWFGMNMLSQARIFVRSGQTWVSWAFPPEIMEMVIRPDRYAIWNLRISSRLRTYSSLALYEICARYRDNPSGVTSRRPPNWWIDALSNTAPMQDKKRREWRKFKIEKVIDALAEINIETDIDVGLIEHKKGRAVTEIQFSVSRKPDQILLNGDEPISMDLILKAERAGISEARTNSLIRVYGEDLFAEKLAETFLRIQDKSKSPIETPYAYLKVLLKNAPISNKEALSGIALNSEEAKATQLVKEDKGVLTISKEPETQVVITVGSIIEEVNRLPNRLRSEWVDKAIADLKAKNMFNATHQKCTHEGKITIGILGSKVASLYAEATYGEQWRTATNFSGKKKPEK